MLTGCGVAHVVAKLIQNIHVSTAVVKALVALVPSHKPALSRSMPHVAIPSVIRFSPIMSEVRPRPADAHTSLTQAVRGMDTCHGWVPVAQQAPRAAEGSPWLKVYDRALIGPSKTAYGARGHCPAGKACQHVHACVRHAQQHQQRRSPLRLTNGEQQQRSQRQESNSCKWSSLAAMLVDASTRRPARVDAWSVVSASTSIRLTGHHIIGFVT
jgi:hypothetical protein